ncbi:RHS repeat-associated core domain-containing protein [Akkermansia sp. N21169]|uniref:RHS repeat-associated core domain-containing protein n=1 Tax=Akkermansia sp. N21169 TaxID=3040765 RepID=UPI00244EF638|nr:RHS repeat-associated core domain-containing protein [Akkermansia sp. N21169]MDH3067498.1 RHS repeat-associated core domain-containing protein [Akkermansia sp. N21169]
MASYDYAPYNRMVIEGGSCGHANPLGFSSEITDRETGTMYYNYRDYNPTDGRWLTRDPIGERGGHNLYNMLKNNTISMYDILGLSGNTITASISQEWYDDEGGPGKSEFSNDNFLFILYGKASAECIQQGDIRITYARGSNKEKSSYGFLKKSVGTMSAEIKKYNTVNFSTNVSIDIANLISTGGGITIGIAGGAAGVVYGLGYLASMGLGALGGVVGSSIGAGNYTSYTSYSISVVFSCRRNKITKKHEAEAKWGIGSPESSLVRSSSARKGNNQAYINRIWYNPNK